MGTPVPATLSVYDGETVTVTYIDQARGNGARNAAVTYHVRRPAVNDRPRRRKYRLVEYLSRRALRRLKRGFWSRFTNDITNASPTPLPSFPRRRESSRMESPARPGPIAERFDSPGAPRPSFPRRRESSRV